MGSELDLTPFFGNKCAESTMDGLNSVNRVRRGLVDIGHYRIVPYQMELATTCGGPGCPSNISVDNTSSTFLPRGTFSSVSQDFKS